MTMTRVIKGHFDGKVVVLDEPVRLAPNQPVHVTFEEAADPTISGEAADPAHGTAAYVARVMQSDPLSDEDAEQMRQAIEEDCERIDAEPDVNFD